MRRSCKNCGFLLQFPIRAYSSVVERVTDNDEVLSSILSTPTMECKWNVKEKNSYNLFALIV